MAARKKTARKKAPSKRSRVPEILVKYPGASEPMEQSMGSDQSFALDSQADTPEIVTATPEEVESQAFKEKAANMNFMEETITIHIQEVSEKDAQQVFSVEVNGKAFLFERGKTYDVKRKFVETLARAKPTHFECEEFTDDHGVQQYRYPARRGLRYPFSVVEDRNPHGPSWLKSVLAQD